MRWRLAGWATLLALALATIIDSALRGGVAALSDLGLPPVLAALERGHDIARILSVVPPMDPLHPWQPTNVAAYIALLMAAVAMRMLFAIKSDLDELDGEARTLQLRDRLTVHRRSR